MLKYIKIEVAIWLSHFFFVPLQHEKISKYGTRKKSFLLEDLSARLPYHV